MINLLSPADHDDPYPAYARLRSEGTVAWREAGYWLVTGHAEASEILGSGDFGRGGGQERVERSPDWLARLEDAGAEVGLGLSPLWLLSHDPPRHTRMRRQIAAAAPMPAAELRPALERHSRDLVSRLAGEVDLVAGLAEPLPAAVILRLLGVPEEDERELLSWSRALGRALVEDQRPAALHAGWEATHALADYFRSQLAAPPAGSLLARLEPATGAIEDEEERLAQAILLLFAGQETTARFLGNALHALLRHPERMAELHRHPERLGSAVAELLRYDSPVQLTVRVVLRTVAMAGHQLTSGQHVVVCLGAANRDPQRYRDPDLLDFGRAEGGLLTFGRGPHTCLGAPLARWVAEAALAALIADARPLELAAEPEWRPGDLMRGPAALRARIG